MATTLFQAVSSFPGKVYAAFGQVVDTVSGRRAERDRNEFVEFLQEKLVSSFRAGRIRLLPYYDNLTAETPEHRLAYRWLLKEPAIKSAFMSKLLSVMSLDLQVDPASEEPRDKEISSFVEDALRRCHGGAAEIVWSILFGALLEGNGLTEKVFGQVHRGKYRGRPTITKIKAKDSHDYQIEIDEFDNPTKVTSRRTAEEFPMSDFTFWSHMSGFSNPAGMSDLRAVYRSGWMLDTVWKLRAIGLERFTLPIFMSKYPAGRLDIRDSINEAVKKAKALGYLSVPQEAAVEAIEMASKSGSDFDAAIKALQEECFIGIQGATLQAMAGNVPDGAGKSSVHKSTTELFVWYLSVAAATVINDQIIPDLVDLNYADADYPVSWLGGINDSDLKGALDIDLGLLQLGLVQDPKDLARRYRRQMAKNPQQALETLKLIKTMGVQQPPPGGMGGAMAGLPDLGNGGGNGGAVPFDEAFADDAIIDDVLSGLDNDEPEKFTDEPDGPAPVSDQTAATPDSHRVEELLSTAQGEGSKFLGDLARKAITRYVRHGKGSLFTKVEQQALKGKLSEAIAAADLLGRARVRLRAQQLGNHRDHDEVNIRTAKVRTFADTPTDWGAVSVPSVELQPPVEALKYFQSLVPAINVDPLTWLKDLEARAFTMAVATETQLLQKVQAEISARLLDGEHSWGPQAIQDLLEQAGVAPANPQYAEMVFRTNVKDALAKGAHEELQDPDVLPQFPVWKYSAIVGDGRGRPEHSARNGNYYPSNVPFTKVRGEGPDDVCNCRCILPGNHVSGNLLLASQSRYSGDAIEVKTRTGARFSVTLNHPILTDKGFISAGLLNEGDNLVGHIGEDQRLVAMNNVQNAPSLAENVFSTLSRLDNLRITECWSTLDFHGDGQSINHNVEIVGSNRFLRNYIDANGPKHRRQGMLSRRDGEEPGLSGGCSTHVGYRGAACLCSSSQLDTHVSKTNGDCLPVNEQGAADRVDGFASEVASRDARHIKISDGDRFNSITNENAIGCESASQGGVSDSSLNSKFVEGFSSLVTFYQLPKFSDFLSVPDSGAFTSSSYPGNSGKLFAKRNGVDFEFCGERYNTGAISITGGDGIERWNDCPTLLYSLGLASQLDTPLPEPVSDSLTTNAVLPSQLMNRFSSDIFLDEVIEIRRFHYEGPVYDFQSTVGYYAISKGLGTSILVANCDFIAIDKYDWEELQASGAKIAAGF